MTGQLSANCSLELQCHFDGLALFLFAVPENFISKCQIEVADFAMESSFTGEFYKQRQIFRSAPCFDEKSQHFSGQILCMRGEVLKNGILTLGICQSSFQGGQGLLVVRSCSSAEFQEWAEGIIFSMTLED